MIISTEGQQQFLVQRDLAVCTGDQRPTAHLRVVGLEQRTKVVQRTIPPIRLAARVARCRTNSSERLLAISATAVEIALRWGTAVSSDFVWNRRVGRSSYINS